MALVALLAACGQKRAAGEPFEDSADCISGFCVAAGQCPTGTAYNAFCTGSRCQEGRCADAQQQCIRIGGPDGDLEVCVPASLCPRSP